MSIHHLCLDRSLKRWDGPELLHDNTYTVVTSTMRDYDALECTNITWAFLQSHLFSASLNDVVPLPSRHICMWPNIKNLQGWVLPWDFFQQKKRWEWKYTECYFFLSGLWWKIVSAYIFMSAALWQVSSIFRALSSVSLGVLEQYWSWGSCMNIFTFDIVCVMTK